jgi:hypothetical protein
LDEVGQQLATRAVQVDAVAVELPAVEGPDLVVRFPEYELPEDVAVERQDLE